MRVLALVGLVFVVMVTLLNRSCTTVYKFPSPNRQATVLLKVHSNLSDATLRLTLDKGLLSTIELAPVKEDCSLSFAHAAWTPDSTKVAVYFGGALCGNTWVAYDLREKRFLPFETLGDLLRESLKRTYGLDDRQLVPWGGDPLRWMQGLDRDGATSHPASVAFYSRFGPRR